MTHQDEVNARVRAWAAREGLLPGVPATTEMIAETIAALTGDPITYEETRDGVVIDRVTVDPLNALLGFDQPGDVASAENHDSI